MLGVMAVCSITDAQTADTVGKIYTVNEDQPWAEAAAIKDGKFIKVASADDVKPLVSDETEVVDLGGKMVMPGLVDVHNHATGASMGKANLYIKNPNDKDAILAEIKAYAIRAKVKDKHRMAHSGRTPVQEQCIDAMQLRKPIRAGLVLRRAIINRAILRIADVFDGERVALQVHTW